MTDTPDIGTPSMRHHREVPGGYAARVLTVVVDVADAPFPGGGRADAAIEIQAVRGGWQVSGAGAPARYFATDDTHRVWDYVAVLARYHAEQVRVATDSERVRDTFRAQMETHGQAEPYNPPLGGTPVKE